ncbi:hypothetical protein [Frigidibacter sp. MR17.24]|uniref:hypothetical protein n=1 Tax=Frigidibacter sp. MR17.24 TaxID=3127345 RepID=UPI003012A786
MTHEDPLFFWRLNDELSVINAAILVTGNDPSEQVDATTDPFWDDSGNRRRVQRRDYHGFEATFGALKSAINRGHLAARIAYDAEPRWHGTVARDGFLIISNHDLRSIVASLDQDPFFKVPADGALVSSEPNWAETMVQVEDLKRWLRTRGSAPPFFFPNASSEDEASTNDVLDQGHEHYSPELALAVTAWRALEPQRTFRSSVKAEIEAWIASNPDAWLGSEPISTAAKERIATVVNWNKGGGAPRTGG